MFEPNPALKRITADTVAGSSTINSVIYRTGFLLALTAAAYAFTWQGVLNGSLPTITGIVGAIVGLVIALVIIFTRSANPILISTYALAEGVALGAVSLLAELKYPGIAMQAVLATMGAFLAVLGLYHVKVLRATPLFARVIGAALLGILALYLVDLGAMLFGHPLEIVHGNSLLSISVNGIIVLIAAISFVLDFSRIEEASQEGISDPDAWRFSFSLLVGLVWLYIEILRLLSKLRSR